MRRQHDLPTLADAIARLVALGLASGTHQDRQKQRARKMAGDAIDRMGDATTTADGRAIRKRDLLDGPEEFGRLRVDRPRRGRAIQD